MSICNNLKKIRKEKGLKQIELAEKIHISVRTLQKYESGEVNPPLEKVNRLADALNVPVTELLGIEKLGNSDTYINNDLKKVTYVFPKSNGNISYSEAIEGLATFINYIANEEDHAMGSNYQSIIDDVTNIVRGRILILKADRGSKIK